MKNEIFYTKKDVNNTKIALISDIHYSYPGYNLKFFYRIIEQIKDNKPQYICICGDILDESKYDNLEELKNFLNELSAMAPVLVVLGNHDSKTKVNKKWKYLKNDVLPTLLKQLDNVYLLEDDKVIFNDICFYGFANSFKYYEETKESYLTFEEEVSKLKTELDNDKYNVTLFHSPVNIYSYVNNNKESNLAKTDLFLFGHMHNGGLPYFITNFINKIFKSSKSLLSPFKSLFPKFAQGRIYNQVIDGYVYQGVSKFSKSTGFFHIFNNLFKVKVAFLDIKKDNQ